MEPQANKKVGGRWRVPAKSVAFIIGSILVSTLVPSSKVSKIRLLRVMRMGSGWEKVTLGRPEAVRAPCDVLIFTLRLIFSSVGLIGSLLRVAYPMKA